MKKIKSAALLLALCAALECFSACGAKNDSTETDGASESVADSAAENEQDDAGEEVRNIVAMSTDSFELKVPEMSYYFYMNYQSVLYYAPYVGLDTSKPLKEQPCAMDPDGGTWYDYLAETAKESGRELLALCEAARAEGLELDDDDRAVISEQITSLESAALSAGSDIGEYISTMYGPYTEESDILSVYEKIMLASKYMQKKVDEADVSDGKLEEYYSAHSGDIDVVSYLSVTFYSDDFELEEEAAKAKLSDLGNELVTCTNEDEFRKCVIKYTADALGTGETDAEEADDAIDEVTASRDEVGDDELAEWLFSGAVPGQTKLSAPEDGSSVTVILVTKAAGRDETRLKDVRHILFTNTTYEDDAKAREVYDGWVSGGASLEDFLSLVSEYSEDPGSAQSGGLYEDVAPGEMVDEFNDWTFDEARAPGDHGLVETDYGWHIMYFEGDSDMTMWQRSAAEALRDNAYSDADAAALESYPAEVNDAAMELLAD